MASVAGLSLPAMVYNTGCRVGHAAGSLTAHARLVTDKAAGSCTLPHVAWPGNHCSAPAPRTAPLQASGATATYKLKWVIPNELVDNVRGVERSHRISVEFRRPVKVLLGGMGGGAGQLVHWGKGGGAGQLRHVQQLSSPGGRLLLRYPSPPHCCRPYRRWAACC